jgi:hypothetical protein
MSINNIETNYTNLVNPLVTRSVIASALIDGGVLSSGSTVTCSGVFGEGDLIANVQSIDGISNLAISAIGTDTNENGVIATIPPGLELASGEILFKIPSTALSGISNNLVSVGAVVASISNNLVSVGGIAYNQYANKYNINTVKNIVFSNTTNNDTYTYICGGISSQA